ncbi:hypothetical protein CAI21_03405 [Alkalilimnicola ehrlichii]|uniref:Na+/H+ antiporter MnhB subunit-related protein domain-containing protein n=1 Tax=Alkalilimnicola ehrlichii TaxID=351052 RepID=A0A3E0X3B0_9GAMM|nr:MnhB domain-containing protein [Alkalilimnicola ehrlichii]RFA31032.1 hypothetical protein CAI21_03405 [Alkalilimnicola ehrlichii]RFA38985.1 hypothetical protein CAL65_03555 [Alkalilimnicola ehrlichii]
MSRAFTCVFLILALAVGGLLAKVGLDIEPHGGLQPWIAEYLTASGVDHPVTAVLLNFRSWDTLLEVGVLVLAVLAARAVQGEPTEYEQTAVLSPLIVWVLPRLLLVAVLMAAYLFWAGTERSGGAFQGGTVLAAAGILLLLGHRLRQAPQGAAWRLVISVGLLTFLAIGALVALAGFNLLAYPPAWATGLIIAIEVVLTVSIGACFLDLAAIVHSEREGVA